MSSNSSRWLALLGLLAVAGYQNRDKLGQLLGGATGAGTAPSGATGIPPIGGSDARQNGQSAGGGLLDGLRNIFTGGAGAAAGGGLLGGLSDILDRFNNAGQGEVANSWIKDGPNREPTRSERESALGEDGIEALTRQTGLDRDELLERLRSVLPAAVDRLTPEGRLPTEAEAAGFLGRA